MTLVGFALGRVLSHVSQLPDKSEANCRALIGGEWLPWPPIYCAFSGNRGKFMEVFLGSPAVRTTHIWQK